MRFGRIAASSALSDMNHLRSTVEQIQVSVRLARRHGVGFPLEEERGWTPRGKRRRWAEELEAAHATQVEERPVVAQLVAGAGKGQAVHQM